MPKFFRPFLPVVLCGASLLHAGPTATTAFSCPDKVPDGLAQSDWQSIREAHAAGRHAFQPVAGKDGIWQAHNPGQQWTTTFDGRGFLAEPRGADWRWGLELKDYGFPGAERAFSGVAVVKEDGQRLSYEWGAGLQEWWVNDARGLEHGFTLEERPGSSAVPAACVQAPGTAALPGLAFTLAVRGTLIPHVTADARGVDFRDATGATVLTYAGLKVWDADDRVLVSRFETAGENAVRLLVEESGARYPLTIDPIAQQAYLKASNTGASDEFGRSVAVSGDIVVVGAPYEDSNRTGINSTPNESASAAGAAYVFVRSGSTWTQQAYLKASNAGAGDNFGFSVAVSGETVVVGANFEPSSTTGINSTPVNTASSAGAAYVFVRSANIWSQQAYLKASNTGAGDGFGYSVAVSGETVVVGASFEDSSTTGINSTPNESASAAGAAYVFVRNGSSWTQQAYVKASNAGAGDEFGSSVAVSGEAVVVGAWQEDSSTTGINTTPNDSAADAGAAYVFVRNGSVWTQQAYLKASNAGAGDRFGSSLAICGDTVVAGAFFEDSSTTGINSTPNESARDSGAAYVFVRSGSAWTQQAYLKASNTGTGDFFGSSVAVAGDAIAAGAPLEASSTTGINSTPNELASFAGAAYVFVRNGTTWTQQAYLKASQVTGGDNFGTSVGISGATVVVGATSEDSSTTGINSTPNELAPWAGAAYIFTGFGPTPPAAYPAWATTNIPAGQSAAFDADWNRDGILNGVAYVLGTTRFSPTGKGRVPAPPSIPADVNVFLDRSTTLAAGGWTPVASWVNGAAPTFASGVSIVSGEVRDTFTGPRASYRYRVVLR